MLTLIRQNPEQAATSHAAEQENAMTTKMLDHAATPLMRHVARWIDESAKGYDSHDPQSVINDLAHGCSSGMVGHLIYTRDCVRFYRRFRKEIDGLYAEAVREYGPDFKLNQWDDDDPLARDDHNQNMLAWFGFEETARNLALLAGLDA